MTAGPAASLRTRETSGRCLPRERRLRPTPTAFSSWDTTTAHSARGSPTARHRCPVESGGTISALGLSSSPAPATSSSWARRTPRPTRCSGIRATTRKHDQCLSVVPRCCACSTQTCRCNRTDAGVDCNPHCLYHILKDESERDELSANPTPEDAQALQRLLQVYKEIGQEEGMPNPMDMRWNEQGTPYDARACETASRIGYWSPWLDDEPAKMDGPSLPRAPASPNPACTATGCSVKWSWDAAGGGTCKLQQGTAMIPYSNSSGRGTQLASCTYSAPAPSGTVTVHQQLYCHVLAAGTNASGSPTVQAHTSWQNSNNDGDDDKGKFVASGCSDSDPKYSGEGQCCFATSPPGPPKPSPPPPPPSPCAAALQSLCEEQRKEGPVDCGQCAGKHAAALRKAGCTSKDIDRWCEHGY